MWAPLVVAAKVHDSPLGRGRPGTTSAVPEAVSPSEGRRRRGATPRGQVGSPAAGQRAIRSRQMPGAYRQATMVAMVMATTAVGGHCGLPWAVTGSQALGIVR